MRSQTSWLFERLHAFKTCCTILACACLLTSGCNKSSGGGVHLFELGTIPGSTGLWVAGSIDGYDYRAYIPSSYDGTEEVPLLVAMHGTGGAPGNMIATWGGIADEANFIVLAPSYFDNSTYFTLAGDQAIFEMIAEIGDFYQIDSNRIHTNGISTGGTWSFLFALSYADSIASASVFAGGYTGANSFVVAAAQRPVPFYITHGTADPVLSVENARSAVSALQFYGHAVTYDEHAGGHGVPTGAASAAWAAVGDSVLP
ncbi:MAG: hypothetical protein AAF581_15750 [Planctomycetota bacterium]